MTLVDVMVYGILGFILGYLVAISIVVLTFDK